MVGSSGLRGPWPLVARERLPPGRRRRPPSGGRGRRGRGSPLCRAVPLVAMLAPRSGWVRTGRCGGAGERAYTPADLTFHAHRREFAGIVTELSGPMLRTGARQYHIALERGELAEYVLLVGDPDASRRSAAHFDGMELERSNREITSATGTYRGMRLSVMSTGMGSDNVEIVLAEVMEITDRRRSSASDRAAPSSRRSPRGPDHLDRSGAPREHDRVLRPPRLPRDRPPRGGLGPGDRRVASWATRTTWGSRRRHRVLRSAGTGDAHAPRSLS